MVRLHFQRSVVGLMAMLAASPAALAQTKEFADAVLALPSTITADQRLIDDARLFGGIIRSTITNQTGSADDFAGNDQISFLALPRSGVAGRPARASRHRSPAPAPSSNYGHATRRTRPTCWRSSSPGACRRD